MFDKKILVVMFLVFLLGGVFGVAIGSINPRTHDFQLNHRATTIIDNDIILDFQIQSYDLVDNDLNSITMDFRIIIPMEQYNECRLSGDSAVDCKAELVHIIELSASDVLVIQFERLENMNTVVQDFSNELSGNDFDSINETRIDDTYRDKIPVLDVNGDK